MNTQQVKIKLNNIFGSSGYAGFEIVEVTIESQGRKNFREVPVCEDGEWYSVSRWEREDGKVDIYKDVLLEALSNGLND